MFNFIKYFDQLHRDLSWLVANSITEDYLVGVKARTYYEEALMNNFFIPISECLNENQETFVGFFLYLFNFMY